MRVIRCLDDQRLNKTWKASHIHTFLKRKIKLYSQLIKVSNSYIEMIDVKKRTYSSPKHKERIIEA